LPQQLEYTIIVEFLVNLKKEFGRGDDETVKIAKNS